MLSQNSFLGITEIDLTTASSVASGGGVDNITLTPPEGHVYHVESLYWSIPGIAGSAGNHKIGVLNATSTYYIFLLESLGTASPGIRNSTMIGGVSEAPSDENEQVKAISSLWSSYDNELVFRYINNTDANQTQSRGLRATCSVYKQVV